MATTASVKAEIEAAVLAGTSVILIIAKQISRNIKITPGATYARVLGAVVGRAGDSNESFIVGTFNVTILHYLANSLDEDAYLTGIAAADQAVIMVPSFYQNLSGVHIVTETPELTFPDRIGNVIEYISTVQLSIKP